VGCNVIINRAIELIIEIHMDIPQEDEKSAYGIMVGLLATVP